MAFKAPCSFGTAASIFLPRKNRSYYIPVKVFIPLTLWRKT